MKKILTFSIISAFIAFSSISCKKDAAKTIINDTTGNVTTPKVKKYDVKSGIVTYNQHQEKGYGVDDTKIVVYFDNYGIIESKEEYVNDVLKKRVYTNSDYVYDVSYSDKSVTKSLQKYAHYTTGVAEYYSNTVQQTILSDTTIAGKTCKYSSAKLTDLSTKQAGYSGILFYYFEKITDVPAKTTTVTKYEEGVAMPASAFTYPSEFTVTEI